MKAPRTYPLGRAVFSEIRQGGMLYVDKTSYVWDMTHLGGKYVFLSRPRRFGKTLLVSTLEAYFRGQRDLFEGLAIDALEKDWVSHPVLHFDLSSVRASTVDGLNASLSAVLAPYEEVFGRDPGEGTFSTRMESLIRRAYAQTGEQAVILVDEYDSPLLSVLHDDEVLRLFRETVREFYAPLKKCEAMLAFVFLTGITKFSQLSIFSELNNLINISMTPQFAGVCGITQEELEGPLSQDVDWLADKMGLDRKKTLEALKNQYDGYHFSKASPDIYNPYSLLHALAFGELGSYWFESGTPTSLVNVLSKFDMNVPVLEGFKAQADTFDAPAESMGTPIPLLYQGGYLTIKGYDPLLDFYTIGVPNGEVSQGLYQTLLPRYAGIDNLERDAFVSGFAAALYRDDIDEALRQLKTLLAGVPYDLAAHNEKEFQSQLFLIWKVVGAKISTEVRTATGRVDVVVESPMSIYVIELKYDGTAEKALAQIGEKGYLLPYESSRKRLVKVGVNYSSLERTIDSWLVEAN